MVPKPNKLNVSVSRIATVGSNTTEDTSNDLRNDPKHVEDHVRPAVEYPHTLAKDEGQISLKQRGHHCAPGAGCPGAICSRTTQGFFVPPRFATAPRDWLEGSGSRVFRRASGFKSKLRSLCQGHESTSGFTEEGS